MGFAGFQTDLGLVAMAGYLILANVLGYVLYRHGARRMVLMGERMPVIRLVTLSALGGALGANIALLRVARAIRRYPLKVTLRVIFVGQIAVIAALSTPAAPYIARQIRAIQIELAAPLAQLGLGPQSERTLPRRIGPVLEGAPKVLGWDARGGAKTGAFGTTSGGVTFIRSR